MRVRVVLVVGAVLALAACGGEAGRTTTVVSDEPTTTAAETVTTMAAETTTTAAATKAGDDPCALVTPETVASVFGGTSATGAPAPARNCSFTVVYGLAPTVEGLPLQVFIAMGRVKAGFEENRGGVTGVPGMVEMFQPNDVGPYEIVTG